MSTRTCVITTSDYDAALFGDNLKRFLDLVELLKGIDIATLQELLKIIAKIRVAATLKEAVTLSLQAFRLVAQLTPTEVDDRIVEILDSFMTEQFIEAISNIIGGFLGSEAQAEYGVAAAATTGPPVELRAEMEARGIPLALLYRIALELLPLIELFMGAREKA